MLIKSKKKVPDTFLIIFEKKQSYLLLYTLIIFSDLINILI